MKKILSVFAALLIVASVSAQQLAKVNLPSKQELTPTKSMMKYQAPKSFKAKKKATTVNATSGDQFVGKYVQDDWNYTDNYDFVGSTVDVAIEKSGDNYVIKNWYGYGYDITCTFADGKLVAEPLQVMYNHQTYGNVGLCPWDIDDEDNIVADPEAQVSFSLKDDGSVEMDNFGWMMLILEGAYAGYNFIPYFMFTTLYPVTATAVDTDPDGNVTSYEVAVEAEDDVVYIHGLGQLGSVYAYPVDWATKTGVMPDGQDVLYYNDQYGMFSTLGLVIQDGQFYLTEDGNTVVNVTENSMTLGNYGFANEAYQLLTVNDNTVITLNDGKWPAYYEVEAANGDADCILPSFKWGGNYSAYTQVFCEGNRYEDSKYNVVVGTPAADSKGNAWYAVDYNASKWTYGNSVLPNSWADGDIMGDVYARRYFTVDGEIPGTVYMPAAHDDAPCEFYINGELVWAETDGWKEDEVIRLTDAQKALIKTDGTVNVFAFHVHQNWGGRYADGGLYTAGNMVNDFNNDVRVLDQTIALAEAEGVDADVIAYAKSKANYRGGIGAGLAKVRQARKLNAGTHADVFAGVAPADGVEAYLYNVGTGLFLAGNNDWGTHASVTYAGAKCVLAKHNLSDMSFGIRTNLPNGIRGNNDWLGHNGYVDCGGYNPDDNGWAWTFEAVGDGSYRIINAQNGGSNIYLGVTDDERLQVDTDKSGAENPLNLWKLVTAQERMQMIAKASDENPVDLTFLIHQSDFSQNDFDGNDKGGANGDLNDSAWERNAGSIWNWKGNDANGDYVFEVWNTGKQNDGPIYLKQTINGLVPGTYRVSATGFYRDGSYDHANSVAGAPEQWAYLTANDEAVLFPAITDEANMLPGFGRESNGLTYPDNARDAARYFSYGLYTTTVDVEVGEDGVLTIGMSKERTTDVDGDDWVVVDNFRLACLKTTDTFATATYSITEDTQKPAVAVQMYSEASTVFVDRYNFHNVEITVTDENGVKAANVVDTNDNYSLVLENGGYVTTSCDVTALILDQELASGNYTVTFPAGSLVMGEGIDFNFNKKDLVATMHVDNSAPAKLVVVNDADGIADVEAAVANGRIYNLQGVEVKSGNLRGLYIHNGKKYIVK